MPGTTLVMGGRLPALGAILSRSVCGVNANAGSVGMELSAGVVAALVVVRSVEAKQVTSVSASPSRATTSVQVGPDACAPSASCAGATTRKARKRFIEQPLVMGPGAGQRNDSECVKSCKTRRDQRAGAGRRNHLSPGT